MDTGRSTGRMWRYVTRRYRSLNMCLHSTTTRGSVTYSAGPILYTDMYIYVSSYMQSMSPANACFFVLLANLQVVPALCPLIHLIHVMQARIPLVIHNFLYTVCTTTLSIRVMLTPLELAITSYISQLSSHEQPTI